MTVIADNRLDEHLTGAYCDQSQLLQRRLNAADISLKPRRQSASVLAGGYQTRFRGRGIEFAEVRPYQAGDDIRMIDWRVTARSDRPYTRLFHEERERPLLFAVDQRQSMFFGSRHCFKSVMACHLASLLAWSGLHQGDRVGGLVFGNEGHRQVRPRRSRQTVLQLIHHLIEFNQALSQNSGVGMDEQATLTANLQHLHQVARPGSSLFIISDFRGFSATNEKLLFQLCRHCEVTALQVVDQLELKLPPPGLYSISDGNQQRWLNAADKQLQLAYRKQATETQQRLQSSLNKLGISLLRFDTDEPLLRQLLRYFYHR